MNFKLIVVACLLAIAYSRDTTLVRERRAINGVTTSPGMYPYQVSIQYYQTNDHLCGGSIIGKSWILTAAHCLNDTIFATNTMVVKAGEYHLGVREYTEQIRGISLYVKHEHYDRLTVAFDIGLIKLAHPLYWTKYVSWASLPSPGSQPSGQAMLAGWGSIGVDRYKQHQYPQDLRAIKVPIINSNTCSRIRASRGYGSLPRTCFCTGSSERTATCFGDSGGGLVQRVNGNYKPIVIGIVSWGVDNDCTAGVSGYTRVSLFNKWIDYMTSKY